MCKCIKETLYYKQKASELEPSSRSPRGWSGEGRRRTHWESENFENELDARQDFAGELDFSIIPATSGESSEQ